MKSLRPAGGLKPDQVWYLNQWLGKLLAAASLNHVACTAESGAVFYHKRRRWYAGILIRATKSFLHPSFYVLPRKSWLKWEATLYYQFYSWDVRVEAGELIIPAIPGTVLAGYLKSANEVSAQLAAIAAAIRALRQLHETRVRFPDGGEGFFSHGDASAENVIYEPGSGLARWFDFETIHESGRPREWRRADDLRALTYSVAALLPPNKFPELARSLRANYPDPPVLRELVRRAAQLRRKSDPFHLGQTNIDYCRSELWVSALQTGAIIRSGSQVFSALS